MVHNQEKLELATQYRKRGFSYSEIAKICGVSKSTVSNWLSKKAFSKKVKQSNIERAARENKSRIALLNKAKAKEREVRSQEAIRSANTEYKHYKTNPLFVAGLSLYLADGDMAHPSQIRLTSTSPEAHRIFQKFLKDFCGCTSKEIGFWLLLPSSVSKTIAENVWEKKLKRSKNTFGKTQVIQSATKALHNGTGNTIIGSTLLKQKLTTWLSLATKELSK